MQLREMIPEVDTHTHTVLSGHAWSTLTENCLAAKKRGMKGLCLTEHAPGIECGAPAFIPHSQRMLPDVIEGIRVYKGVEMNILDHQNDVDIPPHYLKLCEFVIASIHTHMFPERADREANTATYLEMLRNPWVDILGHADDPSVPCEFEALVAEAKRQGKLLEELAKTAGAKVAGRLVQAREAAHPATYLGTGKLLELNNNSTTPHRPGSLLSLKAYILCCKENRQRVCVASDAHFHTMVGSVTPLMTLLDELEFPQELIVNLYQERLEGYLQEREARLEGL